MKAVELYIFYINDLTDCHFSAPTDGNRMQSFVFDRHLIILNEKGLDLMHTRKKKIKL